MENNNVSIPKTSTALAALFRADIATMVSNRRSVIITLVVPIMILISWKDIAQKLGGAYALSTAIGIGLMSIGLMGYSLAIARDRDKGIFQRLRVAPLPSWAIMVSRIAIQLAMISILNLAIFIVGYQVDKVTLTGSGYVAAFFVSFLGGAVYLSMGQLIVGLVKNPETVNATVRLVYFLFIMIGMFGELGLLGNYVKEGIHWTPYGSVKLMIAASMNPATWNKDATTALLLSLGYIVVFAGIGINKFRWSPK
ncbi:ABC transporter permease [Mucilaginibacter sp. dw_454]|uniref:ABC transporter permease n=1 Tax=Mucilaginibacter sp. dw_454 TaxID=2720079 RepID=UPI001BD2A6C3|nr:ABC transporter permease [Mucilaginibacter sp. dw_454]